MSTIYNNASTVTNGATVTIGGAGSSGSGHTIVGGLTSQPLGSITLSNTTGTSYFAGGGGGGGAGQIYTTTGTSNSWITPNNYDQVLTVNTAKSHPTLEVKGNLVINGVDLEERLKTIEKVLQIPERDVKLEKKHPKLKKLYDEYIAALGKYRTFEAIKGEDE
jgi:hypothetical protein